MNKIYVVAGTFEQYHLFRRQLSNTMAEEGIPFRHTDIVYVNSLDTLRGHRDVWGYKVGTWNTRKDIEIITEYLEIIGSPLHSEFIPVLL